MISGFLFQNYIASEYSVIELSSRHGTTLQKTERHEEIPLEDRRFSFLLG